jgi:hypothetical protein
MDLRAIGPILLGLVSTLVGGFLIWTSFGSRQFANSLEHYEEFSVSSLEQALPGTLGYLRGRISESNPVSLEGLVIYERSLYLGRDDDGNPQFEALDSVTPVLLLIVEGQDIALAGGEYSFGGTSTTRASTDVYLEDETVRYRGFEPGDWVVAVGSITANQSRARLQVQEIWGGTFADFYEAYASGASFSLMAGVVFLAAGMVVLIVGIKLVS